MTPLPEVDLSEGAGIRTAVDVLVVDIDGKVLLGEHVKAGKKVWGFPGGHQKTGEQIRKTALRELDEELGPSHKIEITSSVIAIRENVLPPWFIPHVTIVVLGKFLAGEIVRNEPEKVLEWQWFNPEELPENLYSGIADVITCFLQQSAQVVTDWHVPENEMAK